MGHYRQWQQAQRLFVVRGRNQRIIKHAGVDKSLCEVVKELDEQQLFRFSQGVECKGKAAKQYVAQTHVVIDRPAKARRTRHGGHQWRVPGAAIE